MKKLSFIFLTLIIVFSSCDGRKNQKDSLKESITKFKDSIKPIVITEYIPKAYTEIKTDTILSNGFSIKIKTYTDMEKSISYKHKIDTITHKAIYRGWISEVSIKKDGKLIFSEIINNEFFSKNGVIISDYLENSILTGTQFDDEFSTEEDSINLFSGYLYPKEKEGGYIMYNIKINSQGDYTLNKIDFP